MSLRVEARTLARGSAGAGGRGGRCCWHDGILVYDADRVHGRWTPHYTRPRLALVHQIAPRVCTKPTIHCDDDVMCESVSRLNPVRTIQRRFAEAPAGARYPSLLRVLPRCLVAAAIPYNAA